MNHRYIKKMAGLLVVAFVSFLLSSTSAWAGREDPKIIRVIVNSDNTTATISGLNFVDEKKEGEFGAGNAPPVVRIGWGSDPELAPLTVTGYDNETIDVELPDTLGAGDYKLSVAHHYPDDDDGKSEEKKAAQWDLTVGAVGPQGDQGIQGKLGDQGVQGKLGDQGVQGKLGDQGVQGKLGDQGVQGKLGDQGVQGKLGDQGVQGKLGAQGVQGKLGAQGVQGKLGAQGVQGKLGDQGVQGKLGDQGVQGKLGDQGVQGKLGDQGVQGKLGDQGVQGKLGDQGVQGKLGDQGVQGKLGAQGVQGKLGAQGVQGKLGDQGVQGKLGDQGVQGKVGPQGEPGETGPTDPDQQLIKDTLCWLAELNGQPLPTFCPPPTNLVFISSELYDGNLGGVAGADATCQTLAFDAGLPGTYKAWISGASGGPATSFVQSSDPYVMVNGTQLAANWSDLTDGSNPTLNVTESGVVGGPGRIWTGTEIDGTSVGGVGQWSCGWATSNSSSDYGLSGSQGAFTGQWTRHLNLTCDTPAHIYCFEQ